MPIFKGYEYGEVFMWRRDGDISEITYYNPERKGLTRTFPALILVGELQEVNDTSVTWQEVCILQFGVSVHDVHKVIKCAPNILLLADVGCRQHHFRDDVVGSSCSAAAPHFLGEEMLDVELWPPKYVATNVSANTKSHCVGTSMSNSKSLGDALSPNPTIGIAKSLQNSCTYLLS